LEAATLNEPDLSLYRSRQGYDAIRRWYDGLLDSFEVQVASHTIDTRFGSTHMLVAGPEDGEPIVLVQALAGSAPLWYHQMPALAQQYRVYALDTPGQPGRSAPNPPPLLKGGYSNWLLDVLDALGLPSAHFAGVSSASWYIMRLAIQAPERVRKLVMVSPTGIVGARFPFKIMLTRVLNKKKDADALEDDLTTRSFMPESATEEYDRQLARAMALATRHYRLEKSLGIVNERTGRISTWASLKLVRTLFLPERRRLLKQLRTPGLIILGEHEMLYNSPALVRRVKRSLPTLDAVIIPGTGHSAMYDRPDLVNAEILSFLGAASSSRG